jgi:hypothetical protein
MTAIVGIICKEGGVVIGADTSVTFGAGRYNTIEQKASKIQIVSEKYILAGTGPFGLGQRFKHELEEYVAEISEEQIVPVEFARKLSVKAWANFTSTQNKEGEYGALLAFPLRNGDLNLCEFDVRNLQPELKDINVWYVSMGSGQMITDPFLGFIRKIFWKDGMPTVQQAIFATLWTLQHAVHVNPGGINAPIEIATLQTVKGIPVAKLLSSEELDIHSDYISNLEAYIGEYKLEKSIPTIQNELPPKFPSSSNAQIPSDKAETGDNV